MKTLHNSDLSGTRKNVSDVCIVGDDLWQLLSKASSKEEGWMKSTKAMEIPGGGGCVVQVTTQQDGQVAEAVTYVPNVKIVDDINGGRRLSAKEDHQALALQSIADAAWQAVGRMP